MRAWLLTLIFAAAPALAEKVDYYSWQQGGHDSIICAKSDKQHGSLGDCERPGPKDLTELVCDPKFAPGSGIKKEKLSPAWIAACKKYEDSDHHAIVEGRATQYFAWQQGAHDSIECKQVAKGFGTAGKCIYPGPKNYKELICTEQFFKYSGEKVDDDVFCHRHPWKPPVRTADDGDGGGDDNSSASANVDGGSQDVMPNPAADRGDSGVSSELY